MRRVHGVRMRDFWRGKITARELMVLVKFLPADSELVKAVVPDQAELARYRPGDYVLMDLFDATVGKAGAYPRPHEAIEQRRRDQERVAMFEAQDARIRARQAGEGAA